MEEIHSLSVSAILAEYSCCIPALLCLMRSLTFVSSVDMMVECARDC